MQPVEIFTTPFCGYCFMAKRLLGKKGVAFAEFLHSSQPGNAITPRVPDPITMNYRYKISSGKVNKIGESPYKHKFDQMTFERRDIV